MSVRNGILIGYLEQDPDLAAGVSVIDALFDSSNPVMKTLAEYEVMVAMGDQVDTLKMQSLIDRIDSLHAWDYEARAREILSKLGIRDLEQQCGTFGRTEKARCTGTSAH